MAKVTISIEDVEGNEGAINMNYSFNPELPEETDNAEENKIPLTPAQTMAMHIFHFLQKVTAVSNEEETSSEAEGEAEKVSAQEGENTCCGGGNCHTDSTEA
jgi:hypothetical protein